jgi:hypothetical protein
MLNFQEDFPIIFPRYKNQTALVTDSLANSGHKINYSIIHAGSSSAYTNYNQEI